MTYLSDKYPDKEIDSITQYEIVLSEKAPLKNTSRSNKYSLEVENAPTTILGCWVINHKFKGYKTNDKIGVSGSYDVNIWYSYDNDSKTAVVNKNISYDDLFNVKLRENADLSSDTDIIVRTLKQPSCSGVNINNKTI